MNCMKPTIIHHILTHVEWFFNPNMVGEVRDLKFLKIPISYYIPWHYHFPQLSCGKFPMSLVVPLEKMESRLQPGQQHLAQTHQRGAAVGTGGSTAKAPRCGQDRSPGSPGSRSCHGSWMVMVTICYNSLVHFFWLEKTMEQTWIYKYSHDLPHFEASLFPRFWRNKCSIPNLGSWRIMFWCSVIVKWWLPSEQNIARNKIRPFLQMFCCHVWWPTWLFLWRN